MALGQAYLLRSYAVDGEIDAGLVEQLVQVHVDSPGNHADLFGHPCRKREIARHVGTDDLNVNRRRQTKVQSLGDNVGRLKEERNTGEGLRQFLAQFLYVAGCRAVLGLKGDEDLGIEIAHGFAIAVREIDSARRQADVVENASQFRGRYYASDDVFHVAGDTSRLFDSSARLRSHMEPQLAGIDGPPEVLSQACNQQQACQAKEQKAAREESTLIQT